MLRTIRVRREHKEGKGKGDVQKKSNIFFGRESFQGFNTADEINRIVGLSPWGVAQRVAIPLEKGGRGRSGMTGFVYLRV